MKMARLKFPKDNKGVNYMEGFAFLIFISIGLTMFTIIIFDAYTDHSVNNELLEMSREAVTIGDKLSINELVYEQGGVKFGKVLDFEKLENSQLVPSDYRYNVIVKDLLKEDEIMRKGNLPESEVMNIIKLPVSIFYSHSEVNPGIMIIELGK